MWLNRKTDLQIYFAVNVGLHVLQHQPIIFSQTYANYISYKSNRLIKKKPTWINKLKSSLGKIHLRGKVMAIKELNAKDRQQSLDIFGIHVLELKR